LLTEQENAEAVIDAGQLVLRSPVLNKAVDDAAGQNLVLYFEGSKLFARCLAQWWSDEVFDDLNSQLSLRLTSYDLPPATTTLVDTPSLVASIRSRFAEVDPDLFAVQATRFLDGPHVLERLLDHLMELRAVEAPNFITVAKGLSDQLQSLLVDSRSPVQIQQVVHSHVDLWARVQGRPMDFIDGGVARLVERPGIDQFAMRVGTYRVTPGETDPKTRERWSMFSRVLADLVEPSQRGGDTGPDRKRLQEAIRYTLETLVLLRSINGDEPPSYAFLHGPLVNQFVTYDEDEPYFLPDLLPEFLAEFGLTEDVVRAEVHDIPHDGGGQLLWNQFMAIYAAIIRRVLASATPAIGVVERGVGRPVTLAVLHTLNSRGLVEENFVKRFDGLLKRFAISDDLLFGCVLKQGEYITPVTIKKNPLNRAHDQWRLVVQQYGNPRATFIKPHDGTFPVRLELNATAAEQIHEVASVSYHTSRLLPHYAFPVGIDIVDKYAKVPDWMTRAVSTAGAAALLRKAVEEADDPVFISAVRRQLAGQPRDFFFRPTVT
jgi:hypothetical protein